MLSECHGSTRRAKTALSLLTFRVSNPWDCTFKCMLCLLFQSTFFLLIPPPSGLLLTCVFTREPDLHLLSCLQCGFKMRVSGPSLRTDTNSDGWLYFLSPKSFILKTVLQALKEFQHLQSTW